MGEETTDDGGRRIVATTFVTLDGYMVGPDEDVTWVAQDFDPEMQEDIADYMGGQSDLFIFGTADLRSFWDQNCGRCPRSAPEVWSRNGFATPLRKGTYPKATPITPSLRGRYCLPNPQRKLQSM